MTREAIKYQIFLLRKELEKQFDPSLVTRIRELEGKLKKTTAGHSSL